MTTAMISRITGIMSDRVLCGSFLEDVYNREREVNRMNYTYILKCSDGTYYTGWTNDMAKRLKTHNEGKGAKYTRARLPVTLAYYEAFETKEEAMRREWEIKQLSRKEKEKLIL